METDDSRTAAFERKRTRADTTDEGQDGAIAANKESAKRQKSDPSSSGTTGPFVNWNQGASRPVIRTSLGSRVTSLNSITAPAATTLSPGAYSEHETAVLGLESPVNDPDAESSQGEPTIGRISERQYHLKNIEVQDDIAAGAVPEDRVMKDESPTSGEYHCTENSSADGEVVAIQEDRKLMEEDDDTRAEVHRDEDGHGSESTSNYEDDKGVLLNLVSNENSGLESGEITEGDDEDGDPEDTGDESSEKDEEDDSERDGECSIKEQEEEGEIVEMEADGGSAEEDAMMDYADSENTQPSRSKRPTIVQKPTTLSELGPKELRAQLCYFYQTRDPETVPGTDPVRCLVCARSGHTSSTCPSLTCVTCSAYKKHFAHECPLTAICSKCRQQGHTLSTCPSKLRATASDQIPCNLCHRHGHTEPTCEVLWRTSGYPWLKDLPVLVVPFYCYECGGAGHLGNDCPDRRPGKGMASTSWSACPFSKPQSATSIDARPKARMKQPNPNLPQKPQGSRGARGKAQGQGYRDAPVEISSDEDDGDAFFRRPPPRAPRGQMRINGPSFDPPGGAPPRNYDRGLPHYDGHRDDNYNRGGGVYSSQEPRHSYFDSGGREYDRRRSRSPPRAIPRGGRNMDRYVPMPRAAANAYKRGRM